MREIKFRVWNGESLEELLIDFTIDKEVKYKEFYIYPDDIFMQYTGLKDKNKKEIYEGDIVKNSINDILEVLWDDDRCCFEMRGRYDKSHVIKQLDCDIIIDLNIEVIGNIYENPELLEQK